MTKKKTSSKASAKIELKGYSTKAAVERDVLDFGREEVFTYRPTIFPSPASYAVAPVITGIKFGEDTMAKGPAKWKLQFTLTVDGDRADEWLAKVIDRINIRNGQRT